MTRHAQIQQLIEQMRQMERHPSDCATDTRPHRNAPLTTGWDAIDRALSRLGGGLMRGAIHEWFTEGGSPLCVLEHLAKRAGRAAIDASGCGAVMWIGRACWPYPWAMAHDGVELLNEALWVDPPDIGTRLWATDLAARCSGVAAVIADGSELTMAATRRLQLAAQSGGTLVLLSRPGRERDRLSAATTRWLIRPARSPTGRPRWEIRLIRCKPSTLATGEAINAGTHTGVDTGMRAGPPPTWHLEWDDATGAIHMATDVANRPAAPTQSNDDAPQHPRRHNTSAKRSA